MLQSDFLAELLRKCKKEGIHTAVDTAGCVPWENFMKVLRYTDMFLYDIKAYSENLHKEGTGVSNKLIHENLKKLSNSTDKDIIIRIPVIPGYNADVEELSKIAAFLRPLRIKAIELLPYHRMGDHKYESLGRAPMTYDVPSEDEMESYRQLFKF
jgi:pyruvate formate lyase activating enzyme